MVEYDCYLIISENVDIKFSAHDAFLENNTYTSE